jgi:uncharacterized protein YodC (DUF2158 family)
VVATEIGLTEGDLVRLKSGGPLMTVTEVDRGLGYVIVFATWFDEKHELRSGSFPMSALSREER